MKKSFVSGQRNLRLPWITFANNASFIGGSPLLGNIFTSTYITRTHRSDLKPDNILLDAMGHAHITDFNVAIHYSERRLHTSVAGSMAYMAPEVLGRKGYTWSVDWWGLGVVAWELLFHRRPFEGRSAEKMTQSILKDPLKFPPNADDLVSQDGQEFLRGVSRVILYIYISLYARCSKLSL